MGIVNNTSLINRLKTGDGYTILPVCIGFGMMVPVTDISSYAAQHSVLLFNRIG